MYPPLKKIFVAIEVSVKKSKPFRRYLTSLKDTHRDKAPSNKTPALRKSTNMGVFTVTTLNQIFIKVLKLKQNFQKNKVVTGKTPFSVIGPFCSYHYICLNIGF